jgi:hypothetical protein
MQTNMAVTAITSVRSTTDSIVLLAGDIKIRATKLGVSRKSEMGPVDVSSISFTTVSPCNFWLTLYPKTKAPENWF